MLGLARTAMVGQHRHLVFEILLCRGKISRSSAQIASILNCCAERPPMSACNSVTSPSNTLDFELLQPWKSASPPSFEDPLSSHWLSTSRQRNKTCGCLWLASDVACDFNLLIKPVINSFAFTMGSSPAPEPIFMTADVTRDELREISRVLLLLGEMPHHRHHCEPLGSTVVWTPAKGLTCNCEYLCPQRRWPRIHRPVWHGEKSSTPPHMPSGKPHGQQPPARNCSCLRPSAGTCMSSPEARK